MQPFVLDDINPDIDVVSLASSLRVREGSSSFARLQDLSAEALAVARPKGIYGLAPIDSMSDDSVIIDGRLFTSRVLAVNLDGLHRVFPYAVTCGAELEAWANQYDDMLHRYWADQIMDLALRSGLSAAEDHMQATYGRTEISRMAPGSLADWPLSEQRPLFDLLEDPSKTIGLRLTESMLMLPVKSVSGIAFHSERSFVSCQLCPRRDCPNRSAPFNRSLRDTKYHPVEDDSKGAAL